MGPGCQLLLDKRLTDDQLSVLNDYINKIGEILSSSEYQEWNFLVDSKRFLPLNEEKQCVLSLYVWEGLLAEYGGSYEIEEEELKQLEQAIGFRPWGHIQLDAAFNSESDHLILAKIAVDLLKRFGGFIDFGGILNLNTDESIPGKIYTVSLYDGDSGYQVADYAFLEYWLTQTAFRMIK